MPTGRPSKYTPEILEKAQEYLETWEQTDAVPDVAGLSKALGVAPSTLYLWCEDPEKAAFSETFRAIQTEQRRVLVNMGLKGVYNAAIVKLMLHNHGFSDKTENTHQGGDKPIETKHTIEYVGSAWDGPSKD